MLTVAFLLTVLTLVLAAPRRPGRSQDAPTYYPASGDCTESMIPIIVNTHIASWNATKWDADNYQLTDFISHTASSSDAGYPSPFGVSIPFSGAFQISATFCTPKNRNGHEGTVILASHGMGFGRGHVGLQ